MFLGDGSQWTDTDGDGYGDNQSGTNPDAFQMMKANMRISQ